MGHIDEIDFSLVRGGIDDLLRIVPCVPAVYAWFRKFSPPNPDTVSPEEFAEYLETETKLPHMAPRKAKIAPIYKISLTSNRRFSPAKQTDLINLCQSITFRKEIATILQDYAHIFSQPLYIGRAIILYDRVEQHLLGNSGLKESFETAGINILHCKLAYINLTGIVGDYGANKEALSVVEELLSKLFYPPFTIRYG